MRYLYHLHAIFSSLQGEGRNVGRPATFIRFSSCNLACTWCDTHKSEKLQMSVEKIVAKVREFKNRSVIVTGGEPTIQPGIDELLEDCTGEELALLTEEIRRAKKLIRWHSTEE